MCFTVSSLPDDAQAELKASIQRARPGDRGPSEARPRPSCPAGPRGRGFSCTGSTRGVGPPPDKRRAPGGATLQTRGWGRGPRFSLPSLPSSLQCSLGALGGTHVGHLEASASLSCGWSSGLRMGEPTPSALLDVAHEEGQRPLNQEKHPLHGPAAARWRPQPLCGPVRDKSARAPASVTQELPRVLLGWAVPAPVP